MKRSKKIKLLALGVSILLHGLLFVIPFGEKNSDTEFAIRPIDAISIETIIKKIQVKVRKDGAKSTKETEKTAASEKATKQLPKTFNRDDEDEDNSFLEWLHRLKGKAFQTLTRPALKFGGDSSSPVKKSGINKGKDAVDFVPSSEQGGDANRNFWFENNQGKQKVEDENKLFFYDDEEIIRSPEGSGILISDEYQAFV